MIPPFAKPVLIQVALLLISWLALFHSTLLDLINAWSSSDTFQHCYIIAPISLWLLWRRRFMLAEVHFRRAWWLLIPVLLSNFLWYAGSVTGIQVAAHFAVISWLFFACWALLGHGFFRVAWFPMCYLFFMVPIGDEIVPQLQIVTADISVLMLNWTGIPVFREGLYLAIPNGMFEVAVACSGVRYLIASIALGTLFAHLQYHSLKRQFFFLVVAAIVPIIANGVRAYAIVLIAHLSDMKLATGVDHLLYGWVFFGIVMFLLFWAGNYWRQVKAEPPAAMAQLGSLHSTRQGYGLLAIIIAAVIVSTIGQHQVTNRQPSVKTLNTTKLSSQFSPAELSVWQPNFENADDYFTGSSIQFGPSVELYIAFFAQNNQQKELINYNHQLFDREVFTPEHHRLVHDSAESYGTYQITSRFGEKYSLLYWYQLEGFESAKPTQIKLAQSWLTLTSQPDGGAVIVIALPTSPSAEATLQRAMENIRAQGQLW